MRETELMRTIEGIVLYRDGNGDQSAADITTCPDIARVIAACTRSLIRTLTLLLGADEDAQICIGNGHAILPIAPALGISFYASLASLLEDAPDISRWLAEWATSPTREPDLSPQWARRQNVDSEQVRTLASAIIVGLATSTAQRIEIESTNGRTGTLSIPARAQLAPQAASKPQRQTACLQNVVPHLTAVTPMGTSVHIPAAALPGLRSAGSAIEIHTSRTYRTKAQIARAVRQADEEVTDDQ